MTIGIIIVLVGSNINTLATITNNGELVFNKKLTIAILYDPVDATTIKAAAIMHFFFKKGRG